MIDVNRIIALVRFKQHDHMMVKFSNYEIVESLNECIRQINRSFALKNSDFMEARATIDETTINQEKDNALAATLGWGRNWDRYYGGMPPEEQRDHVHLFTGIDLPRDFVTLISVDSETGHGPLHPAATGERISFDAYRISGGKIYCNAQSESVIVSYKKRIPECDEDGQIDLPEDFVDVLVKVTGLVLLNAETDILLNEVNRSMRDIVPARRYAHIRTRMPFKV